MLILLLFYLYGKGTIFKNDQKYLIPLPISMIIIQCKTASLTLVEHIIYINKYISIFYMRIINLLYIQYIRIR